MKRFIAVATLTLLVGSVAVAAQEHDMQHEHEHAAATETATVKGFVIDTACYAGGAHGPEEVGCTKMCLNMGIPASLLTEDGQVLVLLPADESEMDAFKSLKSFAAQEVVITGMLVERDGLEALMVQTVEAAEATE